MLTYGIARSVQLFWTPFLTHRILSYWPARRLGPSFVFKVYSFSVRFSLMHLNIRSLSRNLYANYKTYLAAISAIRSPLLGFQKHGSEIFFMRSTLMVSLFYIVIGLVRQVMVLVFTWPLNFTLKLVMISPQSIRNILNHWLLKQLGKQGKTWLLALFVDLRIWIQFCDWAS